MRKQTVQYYVEGEDEKKLVDTLKNTMKVIAPGKLQKLNVLQELIKDAHLRPLKQGTIVVLIFDTDTNNVEILKRNIKKLKDCSYISSVITIPQVPNLEGELVRSCNIRQITELLNSRSARDYKSDLIRISNLHSKLEEHNFDINKFWSEQPGEPYQDISNDAEKIKL